LNGYRSRQQSTKRHDFIAPQMALLSPAYAESTGCEWARLLKFRLWQWRTYTE